MTTTAGSLALSGWVPPLDSEVARLREELAAAERAAADWAAERRLAPHNCPTPET